MDSIERAKQEIRTAIATSKVPEDPLHAENTLEWLLRLDPKAGEALQIAALGHDIDRAAEEGKVLRSSYGNYDAFKAAHARNSAAILRGILDECGVSPPVVEEACRLVTHHEAGGDYQSDLLKDADGISYFAVNMPHYYQREGPQETKRRCRWGYGRLSERARKIVQDLHYDNNAVAEIMGEVIREHSSPHSGPATDPARNR